MPKDSPLPVAEDRPDVSRRTDPLSGGGEMGALMRSIDWSATAVGPASAWPQSLRTALSILLDTGFPMYIAWGPEFTQFYNDGYRPILGSTKHPAAMGRSTRQTFAEIWDIIGPMFHGVLEGRTTTVVDFLLPLDRHGFVEECYFIFSYSPIREEGGTVGGVLVTVTETTERILGARRLGALQALAARAQEAATVEAACEAAAAVLAENPSDLPFALLYLLSHDGTEVLLAGAAGLDPASASFHIPGLLDSLDLVAATGAAQLLDERRILALPIVEPGQERPAGVLVAGLSPRLLFDDKYRSFLELAAGQVATAMARARTLSEANARAEALAEIDRAKTAFFSNVSHELRTPLTLLLGPAEDALRQADTLPAGDVERWRLVQRNGLRLLKLVNTLLDFSPLEAGRVEAPFADEALRWLPDDRPVAPPIAAQEPGKPETPRARILLADDNADMREYMTRLLRERWDVETAADGAAALARAKQAPPDLILSDIMMPGLDGYELLQALRADPALQGIPVIFLSARAGEEPRLKGLSAGADDYLVKPFSARELLARVEIHLKVSRLRREAERQRTQLEAVLNQIPTGVIVAEAPSGRTLLANKRVQEILGHAALPTRSIADFAAYTAVHPDGRPFAANEYALTRALAGEIIRDEEIRLIHADGTLLTLSVSATPVYDAEGRIVAAVNAFSDISDRKRAEEQRRQLLLAEREARAEAEVANRSKDEFLAMLGHELRNPLAPIVTALHIMRLRGDETLRRERSIIERQVDHLVRLIDDLLDISRITRGKVELKRELVEMSEIVAKALEMMSSLIEQRQHHLVIDVPAGGLAVEVDTVRMAQVVANLLNNAAKYTELGGTIWVSAEREGGEVALRVRDTGIGLSAEFLPRVFDLFVQERQALDRAQGGLGLGLAIVRSLVEMHGGTVEARSEGHDRGSEFVVRLPVATGLVA